MRFRACGAMFCSLAVMAAAAAPAVASGTGGVSALSATPATAPAPAKIHTAPITARTANIAYSGPVYEKTATGQVVPYTPTPLVEAASPTGASTAMAGPTMTTAGGISTGGSAVAPTPTHAPLPGPFEGRPELLVPGSTVRYVDGLAAAPMSAPPAVQEMVWAGNELIGLPYVFGGGHGSFISPGYDCSGTVSFALHGASLLTTPEDSSEFMAWGSHGAGRWVTIFSNPEHAYMTIAGLRLDTSSADDPSNQQGPRWRPLRPANAGFTVRHPLGF